MAAATCTSAPVPGTSEQFDLGDNNTTSITCIQYVDRTFLSITQGGSFGTLIAASTETHPDGACEVHLRTLLGNREDDFANLAATKIQAANFRDTKLPLLLSLGLKQQLDETRLRALLEHLENKRPWLKQA